MQVMAKPKSNKGEECYFLEKKKEVGRRSFEQKSIEEKQEFSAMTVSHWLSCRGNFL